MISAANRKGNRPIVLPISDGIRDYLVLGTTVQVGIVQSQMSQTFFAQRYTYLDAAVVQSIDMVTKGAVFLRKTKDRSCIFFAFLLRGTTNNPKGRGKRVINVTKQLGCSFSETCQNRVCLRSIARKWGLKSAQRRPPAEVSQRRGRGRQEGKGGRSVDTSSIGVRKSSPYFTASLRVYLTGFISDTLFEIS